MREAICYVNGCCFVSIGVLIFSMFRSKYIKFVFSAFKMCKIFEDVVIAIIWFK